jgi:hypothetical protein
MSRWIVFACGALLILCVGMWRSEDSTVAVTETASVIDGQEPSGSEEQVPFFTAEGTERP